MSLKKNKIVIDDISYKKDIDTIKIRNRYYLKKDVAIDSYTKEYELKKNLIFYLAFDNTIQYTSKPILIKLPNGTTYTSCASILNDHEELIINPLNLSEYISLDMFYSFPSHKFAPSRKIYNIEHYSRPIKDYTDKDLPSAYDFLKSYTYGFELETTGLPLDEKFVNDSGFAMLYDGSINGPEYTTAVMKSSNFHHLNDFMKILKSISSHDSTCSFHIHIGNVPYSDTSLKAMYSLFQRLQEDLNLLIAPYKKDYMYLAQKQKDHCQNLPLISPCEVSDIKELFHLRDYTTQDLRSYITRGDKWNMRGRYYSVNFLNYICKEFPNNTVEIRSLQMTFNFDYILTWLMINVAIIKYATEQSKTVLDKKVKIQLEDCLEYAIKDPNLLSLVLYNIRDIKNTIYRKKYIEHSMLTNTHILDSILNNNIKSYNISTNNYNNFGDKVSKLDNTDYYKYLINDIKEYTLDTLVTGYSKSFNGISVSGITSELHVSLRSLINQGIYKPSSNFVYISTENIVTKDKKPLLNSNTDISIYIINNIGYIVYKEDGEISRIYTCPIPQKRTFTYSNISSNDIWIPSYATSLFGSDSLPEPPEEEESDELDEYDADGFTDDEEEN